ncbi:MAG TPA: hydantoinase/oxoprolinase family protein [Candidatus Dormibacteraeota bacterium]|nr:hydantoinase/oxoprolinase family protein [Candidatus Dormibacteraeota bacterium]
MSSKLSIDVGGTFTDVVLLDEETGTLNYTKTPSSLGDPSDGVLNGINKILSETKKTPEEIEYFIHGTTFATNAFLENDGSEVALLTTEGFRDIVEIGRQKRKKLYDLNQDGTPALVERRYRFGIKERVSAKGEVITELDEKKLINIIKEIRNEGIETVAVVYLHSYINPLHEKRTEELFKEYYPECHLSLSHEISPEFREYERTVTTIVNAYLKPNSRNYFSNLSKKLQNIKVKEPYIVKSSGGAMTLNTAGDRVVETLLSGPAGGVTGSTFLAKKMGINNIITLDMGGTSTDVAMILNQSPKTTMESIFKGYPLKVPMIDMETVGAGGGSIGWIDDGNLLKVGPKSAGAVPGPACYGNGGKQPTITDANLVLGRIDPSTFHNGEMELDVEAAKEAFNSIMKITGKSLEESALGVIQIANHHMAEAVRLVTIRKGHDPKDFKLFSFGGASPLHAGEIAKSLNIPTVVIPKISSEMSAFGFLTANIRHDFAVTWLTDLKDEFIHTIEAVMKDLNSRGNQLLIDENVPEDKRLFLYTADLRFKGQAFEISVDITPIDIYEGKIDVIIEKFQKEYERQYGYADTSEPIEIVNYRMAAIGLSSEINIEKLDKGSKEPSENTLKEYRKVYLNSSKNYEDIPVYDIKEFLYGNEITGPAIVDGLNTTILLEKDESGKIDDLGNLIIDV